VTRTEWVQAAEHVWLARDLVAALDNDSTAADSEPGMVAAELHAQYNRLIVAAPAT
jgi:hypothetical protein